MLNKNYISFSCVKCKAEITIKKEFLMFNNCPECGLDSLKIKKLLDDMPSPAPTKITPILKNKEKTLIEVEEYYSNRENTIIDEKYKYANLDEMYSNINYEIKELGLGVNVDKEDFNNLFKDVNHIYRDIISLKDFHKHNIENLESIIIMIFAKDDVTLFQINNQMSYYFDTQINKDTEIVFGIGEASTGDLERVELFYSKKLINKDCFKMTKEEAIEIIYPTIKPLTFEEGFEIYKKFYRQSIECTTTLDVDGYEPTIINGFRLYTEKGKEITDASNEILKFHYKSKLEGFEGEYI